MEELDSLGACCSFSLFHVKEIDSTNTFFKRNYGSFPSHTVLIADHQSQGRGREIRKWVDDNNDLLFSLLMKKENRYEILSATALMKAARKFSLPAFIKWPNDIYIEDKKLAGILIEDIFLGKKFETSIIGIGVNRRKKEGFPSVGLEDYSSISNLDFLKEFLSQFDALLKEDFSIVMKEYTNNNLIYHRNISYHNRIYSVKGFTKEGYLIADNGREERIITSDEISIKESLREAYGLHH